MICMIENNPDLYIREIRDELQARFDRLLSCSRICRALRDNNFSVKVLERIAKERDAQLRFNWRETVRLLQHERLVFIDESNFDNNSVRRCRGRSRRGLPAIAISNLGSKQSLSLIAAVTVDGLLLPACKTYEGGVDHTVLYSSAEEHLLPNLPPGTTLVLDNASIHHDDEFIELLDRAIRERLVNWSTISFFHLILLIIIPSNVASRRSSSGCAIAKRSQSETSTLQCSKRALPSRRPMHEIISVLLDLIK